MTESPFAEAVRNELHSARLKHRSPIHSPAEGYAIILEELDEFWDEVKKKPDARSKTAMREELVQIAAMAQRTAEDLWIIGV